jgi:hypothetical protein
MDYEMANSPATLPNRLEGRLFSDQGRLHLILDVDTERNIARVSFRADGEQQVAELPLADVCAKLSTGGHLKLDGLTAEATARRIIEEDDGWYFTTREGPEGPYPNPDSARKALNRFILDKQTGSNVQRRCA